MFSSAEKTNRTSNTVQQKAQQQTFFRKAGEESFFGGKEQPSFFNAPIHAKLSISSPDDPQEKEADAVADSVMRMPDPTTASVSNAGEERLDKKEEDDIQPKIETPVISRKINCKEEGESIQAKQMTSIFRMPGENDDRSFSDASSAGASTSAYINCKQTGLYHSDIIQRSGRGPPASSIPFEQSLSSSKGAGSALPGDTRQFMESRFNADFSGVRIHIGSTAQSMSSSIHAQAFAHGNDIYFNEGKFSPQTSGGATLLAHELTHTIQQGASPAKSTSTVASKSIARKNIIQRSEAGGVPVQLTNAVEKAKTVEGKIDANKPQADGFRTGWEHLVEIFKTVFGEDMVVSGAASAPKGAVAEQDIKKQRTQDGVMVVDTTTKTEKGGIMGTKTGSRDAMPSWCGIFTFWALNKSGVPMPKWKLGERMIKPEAARLPGSPPMPGDIAYRNAFSHFAIVESVSGNTVKTVNGNTAGEDNLGGQVQTKEHPISDWTAFFNPLLVMTGSLGNGEGAVDAKPKTLAELRKEGLNVNRKEDNDEHETDNAGETDIQAKTEMSNWNVDSTGHLNTPVPVVQKAEEDKELQKKEGEEKEEEKTGLSPVKSIQKKAADELDVQTSTCNENSCVTAASNKVQAKNQNENSSLKNSMDVPVQQNAAAQERGPPVQRKTGADVVQCSVIDDALEYTGLGELLDCVEITDVDATSACLLRKASEIAMHIPGYRALRVVLSRDPITGDHVDRNGRNFLAAAFDIMPGGELLFQKLEEQHQLDAAAAWIDGKIADLESIVNDLFSNFDQFWNNLGITDFGSPMDVLREGAGIVVGFIEDIVNFAIDAALELLEMVKDFLLEKIVEFIQENTTAFPLLCLILGENPITKEPVDPSGTNILNALLELGGEEGRIQRDQMMDTGTFEKIAGYIDEGISVFSGLYEAIILGFNTIWDIVSIDALMNPVGTFTQIYNIFADPVIKVLDFVGRVIEEILKLIKEVLFKRISEEAKKVRGYFLVTLLIGTDPFTGETVDPSVENIIHGFMSLMDGGEEQFQQMKESGAIANTVAKVDKAVKKLNMTLESIIQLFTDLWNSFTFSDFLTPIPTFQRIIATFGEPIGRLIAFVVEIVKIVIVVILEIMNFPFDTVNNIITRSMAAFQSIKRDPIGFLKNLLRAVKQGFIQFFDNIVTHLINGVVGWLMSELKDAGIPELTDFSLQGVIGWVLEVLGLTMEKIWEKLAAHPRIGPERVARLRSMINTLEGIWTFIKDVQERGIAAIWEKIQEQLSNLWNVVLDAVKKWVMDTIVTQVTVKLLGMLDPTGIMAVINSCIAIYSAIQSFIKYMREMLEILNAFVNGVADIAEGNVTTAANYLESTMGRAMPVVIGFLANQVGLGGVGRRVGEMIESVRTMVDEALTWLVNKAVDTGMDLLDRAMAMGRSAVSAVLGWARGVLGLQQPFTTTDGVTHRIYFTQDGDAVKLKLNPTPAGDYEAKMNEINPAPGAMVNVTNAISVPLKRNGAVVATINVPAGNTNMSVLKGYVIQAAQHIDGLIRSNMRTTTDAATQVQDQTPDFSSSLAGLSSITAYLLSAGATGPLPVSPLPVYGGLVNGFASSMDVKPLTKLGVPGSGVSITNPVYQNLLLRRETPGGRSYYIAGHLLNNNVHGSGSIWQNLTPITQASNAQHLSRVETKVKEAVDKDLILHYTVNVEYSIPRNVSLIQQIEAVPNWNANSVLNEKHQILEAEATLPTRLNCTVKQVKADGTDLPATDATYDPQYNIAGAGGIIDNAANVSQASLDNYYLVSASAVTYKDLTTLLTDAGIAIASNTGLTWDTFYNNPANKLSIDNLAATDKETLRNIFRKKDLINEERGRIDNQMALVNWATFTAGRVAYTNGLLLDTDMANLHDRFKTRMQTSKSFFLMSLTTYVNNNLTDSNTTWQGFRSVQQLNERAYEFPPGNRNIIISESEIQNFRTTVFDPRINFLQTNPAP